MSTLYHTYSLSGSITSNFYSDNDIVCEDADGDGYYFWGIGPKPSSCPSWVPDDPDGDDSDYSKGPIDEYGWLRELDPDQNDTIHITNDTVWNSRMFVHNHICIHNGATLTVRDTVNSYQDVSFTIQSNATLSVNGGVINDAIIKPKGNGNVKMANNGRIIPCVHQTFSIPLGAKMSISYGKIK